MSITLLSPKNYIKGKSYHMDRIRNLPFRNPGVNISVPTDIET